ncbi:MAG: hypothetical protein ACT4R6_02610 [Gemmatimonadaceae bacterium]
MSWQCASKIAEWRESLQRMRSLARRHAWGEGEGEGERVILLHDVSRLGGPEETPALEYSCALAALAALAALTALGALAALAHWLHWPCCRAGPNGALAHAGGAGGRRSA